ncbi:hypothetical protein [Dechloromonas hortensis]|uniref:hypothetical protein n=1 Tax=Dechloromonas hortensis TaxID=337779 RepID=UPI001291C9AC|nr:hypothetical protein [Dechloromonas hortensis]
MHIPAIAILARGHHKLARKSVSLPIAIILGALLCPPLQAGEVGDNAKSNAISIPQADIPWMSGGIGEEARDEMRKAAASYNVHIVFSNRQGSYLADIPFAVAGRDGRQIISGVSEGPLLYIKLPPGAYRISAQIDGAWLHRRIQAGTTRQPLRMVFVSRGE